MARYFAAWYGGSSYSVPQFIGDLEIFASLRQAKESFADRVGDPYTPCVSDSVPDEGGPEMLLYRWDEETWQKMQERGKAEYIGMFRHFEYPYRLIRFGRRGGVVVERA